MFIFSFSIAYALGLYFLQSGNPFFQSTLEYAFPTQSDRSINTLTADFLWGTDISKNGMFVLGGGGSVTHAWGNITLPELSLDTQTIQPTTFSNVASGIGPTAFLRFIPLSSENWDVSLEALMGVILFTSPFPEGGEVFNFMTRFGPSVQFKVKPKTDLRLSLHWLSVFNGQDSQSNNPSYSGFAINAGLSWKF